MTYNEYIENIISSRGQWCEDLEIYENHRIIPLCLGGEPKTHKHETIHENLI